MFEPLTASSVSARNPAKSTSRDRPSLPLHSVLFIHGNEKDAATPVEVLKESIEGEIYQGRTLAEAEALLTNLSPDAILADLSNADAGNVIRHIRRVAPNTPLVVITDANDDATTQAVRRIGAQDFVAKSDLSSGAIIRALESAIGRKKQENSIRHDLVEIIAAHEEIAGVQGQLEKLLSSICARTMRLVPATGAVVEMPDGDEMVYRGVAGLAAGSLGLRLKIASSLSGASYSSKSILQCDDAEIDPRVDREACRRVNVASMIVVPLVADGKVVGILKAFSPVKFAFSPLDIERLRVLSQVTGSLLAQAQLFAEKESAMAKLEAALAQVKKLSGLLPICAGCKKIRDDKGYWNQLEVYICDHSEAEFSHGICPACIQRLYPDVIPATNGAE